MRIHLNGHEHDVDEGLSLAQLLEATGYAGRRVAVEVNREIVARTRYGECRLDAGDRIEIVHAIGGG